MQEYALNIMEKELYAQAHEIEILQDSLPGLTNEGLIFARKGRKYIFRRGTAAAEVLGINRAAEYAALIKCKAMCGRVLYFNPKNGDMVKTYVEGRALANDEIAAPEYTDSVIKALKSVHGKRTGYTFNPFEDICSRTRYCQEQSIALPPYMAEVLAKTEEIKVCLNADRSKYYGLCHGDAFGCNFILKDNGELALIDYEFSGEGDIRFDIACIIWAYPPERREEFLRRYFGFCSAELLASVKDMLFIVMIWNALWAAVKTDCGQSYKDTMHRLFADIKHWLDNWDKVLL